MMESWHIECLVCEAQYYTADYPRKGCRNCGRDALLITDNRSPKKITRNKLTSES
jgi:rRNA maturation endonuclease Nob1